MWQASSFWPMDGLLFHLKRKVKMCFSDLNLKKQIVLKNIRIKDMTKK